MIHLTDKHVQALALAERDDTRLEVFEGTVRSSKTVCAITAFILRVLKSDDLVHLIAARDLDAITDNILESNGCGLLSAYPGIFTLSKGAIGNTYLAYLNIKGKEGKILLAGYDKKNAWEKILGKTISCILVDEVNVADEDFIRECFARQTSIDHPFTVWTLNGDDPDHFIYKDYINYCKPLGKVPPTTLADIVKSPDKEGWYYFHWNMKDNPVMTDEKIRKASEIYPLNSHYYNIKILGLRGKAEGAIFASELSDRDYPDGLVKKDGALAPDGLNKDGYESYEIGIDIGNNEIKRGTVITIAGFSRDYSEVQIIDTLTCKSTEINALVAEMSSFIALFAESLINKGRLRAIWLDSYGPIQLMLSTLRKSLAEKGVYAPVGEVPKFGKDQGRKARMELLLILIGSKRLTFAPRCIIYIRALAKLTYGKDGLPEDENQPEMDYYDSLCYSLVNNMLRLNRKV